SAAHTRELGNHQTDRSTAEDGDAPRQLELAEVRRVQRDTERFQQRDRSIAQAVRNRKAAPRFDDHLFLQRAVVGEQAAEVQPPAQIRVSFLAHFAAPARSRRVDCHTLTDAQGIAVSVERPVAHRFHYPAELVSEDQRLFDDCVANPRIKVSMQVGAAHADTFDTNQRVTGGRCRWRINCVDAEIARGVESCSQHESSSFQKMPVSHRSYPFLRAFPAYPYETTRSSNAIGKR